MAKDSFILSATRGAVGNIVTRRSNGQTIISAKPTSVANPRTYAQAEVRMRLSAVSKFYSPLSSFIEQGRQGKNTLNSQSSFSSAAIQMMKDSGWSAPRNQDWFPFPFMLTKGSVPPVVVELGGTEVWLHDTMRFAIDDGFGDLAEDIVSIGALARFFKSRHNIPVNRFQLTIVAAYQQTAYSSEFAYYPVVERIELDTASTVALTSVGRFTLSGALSGDAYWGVAAAGSPIYWCVGLALILSYYDGKQWVRSNAQMVVDPSLLAASAVVYDANVATFMDSSAVSDPEGRVYLDGFTRRSSGGGGGSDFSPSNASYLYGDTATTAKPVSVTTAEIGERAVIAILMDDGTTHVVMGNEAMASFGKAFTRVGMEQITLSTAQQATAVSADRSNVYYFDFYAWVAEQTGMPLSFFFSN